MSQRHCGAANLHRKWSSLFSRKWTLTAAVKDTCLRTELLAVRKCGAVIRKEPAYSGHLKQSQGGGKVPSRRLSTAECKHNSLRLIRPAVAVRYGTLLARTISAASAAVF